MIMLIGPSGDVNFRNTSLFFRANIDDLSIHLTRHIEYCSSDFDIGEESAFRCLLSLFYSFDNGFGSSCVSEKHIRYKNYRSIGET